MQQTKTKKKFFYGWVIVFCCTLLVAAGTGIFVNCLGIFVKPVCEELGFDRGPFTLYSTIGGFVGMFAMLAYGELYRRYPQHIRKFIALGTVVCCGAFYGYSLSTKLWHFYALAAFYGTGSMTLAGISITTLINNWFVEKRGLATGLAFAGSGVSAAIMTPVLTTIVADFGWRMGYRTMSLVSLCLLVPAVLLIRVSPAEKGLLPYGVKPGEGAGENTPHIPVLQQTGITRRQAVKTPAFYLQILGMLCLGTAGMGMSGHVIAYLTDIGYSELTASTAMSLVMTVMIFAKILLGAVFDKIGPVPSAVLTGICMLASVVALRFAGVGSFMPYVFSLCFGFGYSTLTVPYSYLIGQNFGTREFAAIYSLASMISSLGNSYAPSLSGTLYDFFGSYVNVWNIYIVVSVAATVSLTAAAKISRQKGYGRY